MRGGKREEQQTTSDPTFVPDGPWNRVTFDRAGVTGSSIMFFLTVLILLAGTYFTVAPAARGGQGPGNGRTRAGESAVRSLIEKVRPSIVHVRVKGTTGTNDESSRRWVLGVIVDSRGTVFLPGRLPIEAGQVDVLTADGHPHSIADIARDPETGIVVFTLRDGAGMPHINLLDSDRLAIGDPVVALRCAIKQEIWIERGFLSGRKPPTATSGERLFVDSLEATEAERDLLIDLHGHLVGIGNVDGAVPSNLLKQLISGPNRGHR